jgi:hypothetical protein
VEAALLRSGGVAEWRPEWHVLVVPPAVLANARNVFNLAAGRADRVLHWLIRTGLIFRGPK